MSKKIICRRCNCVLAPGSYYCPQCGARGIVVDSEEEKASRGTNPAIILLGAIAVVLVVLIGVLSFLVLSSKEDSENTVADVSPDEKDETEQVNSEKDKDSNITSFPLPSDTTPPIIVDPLPEQEEGDNIITAEDGEEDVKPSLKPYGSNQRANEQAQKQGYDDAHDLKESYVGPKEVAHYDMKYDTKTGEIYLESKDGKIQIPTGLYNIP